MKRKRTSDTTQTYDLVLTDATGRSVRAHRALLVERSDYFAHILDDHNLRELHLNENYLIELIHYLYAHDSDYGQPVDRAQLTAHTRAALYRVGDGYEQTAPSDDEPHQRDPQSDASDAANAELAAEAAPVSTITSSDIEILMRMLMLANKYGFRQLYKSLINEINYKLSPHTALIIYKCARELDVKEFADQTRMMILSWLPQLQLSEEFLSLSEDSIRDIFSAEPAGIESESKLDALSAWWSSNKQANMTDLWVNFMMSN